MEAVDFGSSRSELGWVVTAEGREPIDCQHLLGPQSVGDSCPQIVQTVHVHLPRGRGVEQSQCHYRHRGCTITVGKSDVRFGVTFLMITFRVGVLVFTTSQKFGEGVRHNRNEILEEDAFSGRF